MGVGRGKASCPAKRGGRGGGCTVFTTWKGKDEDVTKGKACLLPFKRVPKEGKTEKQNRGLGKGGGIAGVSRGKGENVTPGPGMSRGEGFFLSGGGGVGRKKESRFPSPKGPQGTLEQPLLFYMWH